MPAPSAHDIESILNIEKTIITSFERNDSGLVAFIDSLTETQVQLLCVDLIEQRTCFASSAANMNSNSSTIFDLSTTDASSAAPVRPVQSAPAALATKAPSILRILLRFERTRIKVINTIIDLLVQRKLSGQMASSCMGEVHVCLFNITRLCNTSASGPSIATNSAISLRSSGRHASGSALSVGTSYAQWSHVSVGITRAKIEQLLGALVDTIIAHIEASTNMRRTGVNGTQGLITVLEFFPTVISSAHHLDAIAALATQAGGGSKGRGSRRKTPVTPDDATQDIVLNLCEKFVTRLLAVTWPSGLFISLLGIFVECGAISCEPVVRQSLKKRIIESTKTMEHGDSAGLMKLLLQLAERYDSYEYIDIIRQVFALMPQQDHLLHLNAYYILELALRHSQPLLKLLIQLVKADFDKIRGCRYHDCFSNILLLLLATSNEMFREQVLHTLHNYINNVKKEEASISFPANDEGYIAAMQRLLFAGSSSSASALIGLVRVKTEDEAAAQQYQASSSSLTQKLIRHMCSIETVSESLLLAACYWCDGREKPVKKIGAEALLWLFGANSQSRLPILETIFNVIAEDPKLEQKQLYLEVIESIMQNYATLVFSAEYLSKIQEWLSYLMDFPLDIALRLLSCFLLSPCLVPISFENFVFNFLRKLMSSRVFQHRYIAIHGFGTLLHAVGRHNFSAQPSAVASSDVQYDIVQLLSPAFNFELSLRSQLYRSLSKILSLETCDLSPRAAHALGVLCLGRLRRFLAPNKTGAMYVNILACFDATEVNSITNSKKKEHVLCEREPVADLLLCCVVHLRRVTIAASDEDAVQLATPQRQILPQHNSLKEELRAVMDQISKILNDLVDQLSTDVRSLLTQLAMLQPSEDDETDDRPGNLDGQLLPMQKRLQFFVQIFEVLIQCIPMLQVEAHKQQRLLELYSFTSRSLRYFFQNRQKLAVIRETQVSFDTIDRVLREQVSTIDAIKKKIELQDEEDDEMSDDEEDQQDAGSNNILSLNTVNQTLALLEIYINSDDKRTHEILNVIKENIGSCAPRVIAELQQASNTTDATMNAQDTCRVFVSIARSLFSMFHLVLYLQQLDRKGEDFRFVRKQLSHSTVLRDARELLASSSDFTPFFKTDLGFKKQIIEAEDRTLLLIHSVFGALGSLQGEGGSRETLEKLLFVITKEYLSSSSSAASRTSTSDVTLHFATTFKNSLDSDNGVDIGPALAFCKVLHATASFDKQQLRLSPTEQDKQVVSMIRMFMKDYYTTVNPRFTKSIVGFVLEYSPSRPALEYALEICKFCSERIDKETGKIRKGEQAGPVVSREEEDDDYVQEIVEPSPGAATTEGEWQSYCGQDSCFSSSMVCILELLDRVLVPQTFGKEVDLLSLTGPGISFAEEHFHESSRIIAGNTSTVQKAVQCLQCIVDNLLVMIFSFSHLRGKFESIVTKLCKQTAGSVKLLTKMLNQAIKQFKADSTSAAASRSAMTDEEEIDEEDEESEETIVLTGKLKLLVLAVRTQAPLLHELVKLMAAIVTKNGSLLDPSQREESEKNLKTTVSTKYERFVFACQKLVTELKQLDNVYTTLQDTYPDAVEVSPELSQAVAINITWLSDSVTKANPGTAASAVSKKRKASVRWSSSSTKSKRQRLALRSKNIYIDHELQYMDDTDTFADLEDFIDDDNLRDMEQDPEDDEDGDEDEDGEEEEAGEEGDEAIEDEEIQEGEGNGIDREEGLEQDEDEEE